jgi:hypothetical protein
VATCYVAVCNRRLIGTMTLYAQDVGSAHVLYQHPDVASVRQFGVATDWQNRGIGQQLLAFDDHCAARHAALRSWRLTHHSLLQI